MSDTGELDWIDATAGRYSANGRECTELGEAISRWSRTYFGAEPTSRSDSSDQTDLLKTEASVAELLRQITGHDENTIAQCHFATTGEQALQELIVSCRKAKLASSSSSPECLKCLSVIGSDHGDGVIERMASGRADSRAPQWPLVPGFDHVPWRDASRRIDDNTAMVLVSPIDWNEMAVGAHADDMLAIRTACDEHGAALVMDHRAVAPMGGGFFWVHDSIAEISADAVMMSAGLCGGMDLVMVVATSLFAETLTGVSSARSSIAGREMTARIIEESLKRWLADDLLAIDTEEFAVTLATRLSAYESIRDLHVTGRVIGIEMDIPAADWIAVAQRCHLKVQSAGDFAVGLQPPLIMSDTQSSDLIDRIVMVFETILASENEAETDSDIEPRAETDINPEAAIENEVEINTPGDEESDSKEEDEFDSDEEDEFEDDSNDDAPVLDEDQADTVEPPIEDAEAKT